MIVQSISKRYEGMRALHGVSLELELGKIHALVGENGAGKSTLLKIMAGILRPDEGFVELDDSPVYENPPIKARIAFVPAETALFSGYTADQMARFFAAQYPKFDMAAFRRALSGQDYGKRPVATLSTGQRVTLSVALALATKPDVLLLDEPFAGLDVIFRRGLIQLLIDECAARPLSVLVSSHNVDELERLSDTATILSHGKVVQSGDLDEVKEHAVVRLQVVFDGEAPQDIADWPGVIAVETIGRVQTIALDAAHPEAERRIIELHPLMCERLPVTLEEAFLYSYKREVKVQ